MGTTAVPLVFSRDEWSTLISAASILSETISVAVFFSRLICDGSGMGSPSEEYGIECGDIADTGRGAVVRVFTLLVG